jgi:catecholate siderophore receptor
MKPKRKSKVIAERRQRRAAKAPQASAPLPKPQQGTGTGVPQWAVAGALMASAALGGFASPAFAQTPTPARSEAAAVTKRFDIPAGRLSAAIESFAQATGITVTDPGAVVGDVDSPGVTGNLSPEAALRRLLTGTGVTYRFATARAVRLQRGALPQLATVSVVGARQAAVSSEKYSEPLRDIPQTITVVPRDILESQGVTSLRDAVRNVTGLTVNAGEGGATPGDNFNIRGFSARSDVFVDGMRDVGGYARETFNIEQIEVSKGPGSVFSGRGSTGGSINLVTKTPHLQRQYSGVVGAGSAEYKRGTIDLNQPLTDMGIPGTAVRLKAQVQTPGVADLDVVKNKSWGVSPSIAIGLGSATQLSLAYFQANQDNVPTYGVNNTTTNGPPPGIDTHKYFGVAGLDFEEVDAKQATAKITHAFGNGWTLRNQTAWGSTDVHRIVTSANANKTRSPHSHITYDQNLSNQTSLSSTFKTGGIEHTVASGIEATHEKSRFANYVVTGGVPAIADMSNPTATNLFTGSIREGRPRRSVVANTAGIYTFDTMKLGPSWEFNLGLRYDAFSPQFSDSLDRELPKKSSRAMTWRTGLVYKPVERGSVYFAYGTSFNPTGELLSLDSRGTIGLDPEKNNSYEVGTKWDFLRSRLLVTAALFRTDKTNARITDVTDPSGTTLVLAGKQRVTGAELGASGVIAENWTLFAGYTYLDGEIIKGNVGLDGTPLPNTPKHSLSVWSTGKLPWDFEIGGGVRFVDDRYRTATQSVPEYWSYDADAAYTVSPKLQLRLNLINLTDATFYDSGRYWVPAAGRSVKLSTSVTF